MRHPVLALLVLLALAGCGRERLPAPDADRPLVTRETTTLQYPKAGLELKGPTGWNFGPGPSPLVAQSSSGSASIAIWRYERAEPLPEEDAQLDAAREALLTAVKARDQRYREVSTRTTEVDGHPALELVGDERIAGRERRVRSTHVFAEGAELVVDQYAPRADFAALDTAIFQPLVRSLRIDKPR